MSKPAQDLNKSPDAVASIATKSEARQQARRAKNKKQRLVRAVTITTIGVLVVVGSICGFIYSQTLPIKIKVNGTEYTLTAGSCAEDLLTKGLVEAKAAGDLIAVDGVVLEPGAGERCTVLVNGQIRQISECQLYNHDEITFQDGKDVVEDCDITETTISFGYEKQGDGALACVTRQGVDGIRQELTGKLSGNKSTQIIEPVSAVVTYYNPQPAENVVSLTFDDGPGPFSQRILDVLKEHGAKATFFCLGANVEKAPELVQEMVIQGHQVATHSFWHNDMTVIPQTDVLWEWQSSEEALLSASGVKTTVGRAPYGRFGMREWQASAESLSLLVNWDVDSCDWNASSAEVIVAEVINETASGEIILFHDGGVKREFTVEALDIVLPQLLEQGYRFITIDELYQMCPPPE